MTRESATAAGALLVSETSEALRSPFFGGRVLPIFVAQFYNAVSALLNLRQRVLESPCNKVLLLLLKRVHLVWSVFSSLGLVLHVSSAEIRETSNFVSSF